MTERIIVKASLPGIVPLMAEQAARPDYTQHSISCDSSGCDSCDNSSSCDTGCDTGCDSGCDTGCDSGCDTGGCHGG